MSETKITEHDTVRRREDAIASSIGDDTVLLSLERNDYFGINPVGTRIWELLENAQPVTKLCQRLQEEFSVSPEECRTDVLDFLNMMAEDGLVETTG